jgi:hypothetical protein
MEERKNEGTRYEAADRVYAVVLAIAISNNVKRVFSKHSKYLHTAIRLSG